jgi:hypothetical protein
MRRRDFIKVIAGSAVTWPLAARAQQSDRMPTIGVLMNLPESNPESQERVLALRDGLRKLGWVDGRNLQIVTRWGASGLDHARAYASELVGIKPEVIFAGTTVPLTALHQATQTLYLHRLPIRSRSVLLQTFVIPEATLPDLPSLNTLLGQNGSICLSKWRQGRLTSPSFMTHPTRNFLNSYRL